MWWTGNEKKYYEWSLFTIFDELNKIDGEELVEQNIKKWINCEDHGNEISIDEEIVHMLFKIEIKKTEVGGEEESY